jgi:predicted DNA-binding transcriptional regulator AlpA
MKKNMDLLIEKDAADYLSVGISALRKWCVQGRGPSLVKLGSLARHRRDDIEAWLARGPQARERLNSTQEVGGTK